MKLGAHAIPAHWSNTDEQQMKRIRPRSIKLVDYHPGRTRQFYGLSPDSLFVLRNHPRSEQKDDAIRNPEETGERHAREWIADLDTWHLPIPRDQIVVLGLNEFPIWWDDGTNGNTPKARGVQILNRYSVMFAKMLARAGVRFGLGNINTGWPANDGPDTPPNWTVLEPLRDAITEAYARYKVTGFLFLHEYWPKAGPQSVWPWNAGRYTQCPWQVPILIGECGMTQRIVDPSLPEERSGWLQHLQPDEYMRQLMWYNDRLMEDRRVHSAQVFTWDAHQPFISADDIRSLLPRFPTNNTFDNMTSFFQTAPTPPPPPPPPPTDPTRPSDGGQDGGPQRPRIEVVWPMEGRMTQQFNLNPAWYPSHPGHMGLDIGAPQGTPVKAVANGTVAYVDTDPGYGQYVRVWHPQLRVHTFYAHLSEQLVKTGQSVRAGDVIGKCGNTGRSTGPHLHWEVRMADAQGRYEDTGNGHKNGRVDPLAVWETWERTL